MPEAKGSISMLASCSPLRPPPPHPSCLLATNATRVAAICMAPFSCSSATICKKQMIGLWKGDPGGGWAPRRDETCRWRCVCVWLQPALRAYATHTHTHTPQRWWREIHLRADKATADGSFQCGGGASKRRRFPLLPGRKGQ